MKRLLLSTTLICLTLLGFSQTFNGTSSVANAAATGGSFGPSIISNAPRIPIGGATLTFYYRGDLNSVSSEYYDLIDETGSTIGRSNATSQCGAYASKVFTIPAGDIASWAADGTIEFNYLSGSGVHLICGGNSSAYVEISYDYVVAPYDVSHTSVEAIGAVGYTEIPLSQAGSYNFQGTVQNSGDSVITGVTSILTIPAASHVDSFNVDTLLSQQDTTHIYPLTFVPSGAAFYQVQAVASMDQLDTVPINDTSFTSINISDTVYARDDTTVNGGLGFNGTVGEFGHFFEIHASDTLSTVSFYLNTPANGTSLKIIVYEEDTIQSGGYSHKGGAYLNPVDSSRTFSVTSTQGAWYTLPIGCGGAILDSGRYLISLLQINPNNMSLGYTYNLPSAADVTYFRAAADTIWTDLKTSTSNVANAVFKVRANLGVPTDPDVLADTLFYCFGTSATITTNDPYAFYTWHNGTVLDSVVVSAEGVYSVSVEDEIGCTYVDSITVVEHPQMTVTTNVTNASCGLSDGSIVASASGTFAPYTYDWSNGGTTDSIGGLAGGTYDLTVTDDEGCTNMGSVLVLGTVPTLSSSFSYPTCNGDNDGSATVAVVSGIMPYTFVWQTGGSGDTESGLTSGSYSVTVTDSSGCSDNITVNVMDPDTLNLSTNNSSNPTSCGANNGVANVSVTGGIAPYTYFWANGQNQASNINLGTGTYDVTVTDANNCVRTASVTLIDPNAPSLTANGSSVTCSYDLGTASVTVTGGTPPFLYLWDNGETDSSLTDLGVGSYNVQVVDAAGCVRFVTADVAGPDDLDVMFTQEDLTGEGLCDIKTNITGGNTPYASFQWREDQGTNNVDIAGETNQDYLSAPNGLYWLVVTDAQGCVDSAQYQMSACATGIDPIDVVNGVSIYPNPTSGKVNVELTSVSDDIEVVVFDAIGNKVAGTTELRGNVAEFDLNHVAPGMYLIGVTNNGDTSYSRIQIVR